MCDLVGVKNNLGEEIMVADLKQKSILNIIDSAKLCKSIDGIILFGSSLETRCTAASDIDIAIISTKTVDGLSQLVSFKKFLMSLYDEDYRQEYDRLYFKSFEEIESLNGKELICNELSKNGKVIYRRVKEDKFNTTGNS